MSFPPSHLYMWWIYRCITINMILWLKSWMLANTFNLRIRKYCYLNQFWKFLSLYENLRWNEFLIFLNSNHHSQLRSFQPETFHMKSLHQPGTSLKPMWLHEVVGFNSWISLVCLSSWKWSKADTFLATWLYWLYEGSFYLFSRLASPFFNYWLNCSSRYFKRRGGLAVL